MPPTSEWLFESFRLDPANACLWRGDHMIALRPKVFAVLACLVTHAGQLVTKEMLFDAVWPETAVTDAVLKACIRELRRALGDTIQTPQFIATVHRRGYRFIASVRSSQSAEDSKQMVDSREQWPVGHHQPQSTTDRQLPAPIVEREEVLQQLHSWLIRATQGRRQLVFITGEPGCGKTAVVEAFTAQAAANPQVRLAWGQCVESYGAERSLHAGIRGPGSALQRCGRSTGGDSAAPACPHLAGADALAAGSCRPPGVAE